MKLFGLLVDPEGAHELYSCEKIGSLLPTTETNRDLADACLTKYTLQCLRDGKAPRPKVYSEVDSSMEIAGKTLIYKFSSQMCDSSVA